MGMNEFSVKVVYFQSDFTYFSWSVYIIDYIFSRMYYIVFNNYTKADKEGPWKILD